MKGKTNAMRLLDAAGISYHVHHYNVKDGKIDGLSVAEKTGLPPEKVFKTLVAQSSSQLYVFVVPVTAELNLKRAAKAAGEKNIDLIPVKDIQKQTGYIRGGCSPLGMKKEYLTFIHSSAEHLNSMIISGGKIGLQIELAPEDLAGLVKASFVQL